MMTRGAAALLAACGCITAAQADTVGRVGFTLPAGDWHARFSAKVFFADDATVTQAAAERGLVWPKSAVSLRSLIGTQTGDLLRVHLMLARNLHTTGAPAPAATQLWGVPPELVGLGEQLRESTRAAALSISGELKLPPFELEP